MVLQAKRKAVASNKAPAKIDLVPLPLFRVKMPGKKKVDFHSLQLERGRFEAHGMEISVMV